MCRVVTLFVFGTVIALGLMADSSRASLYSPDDPSMAFPVGSDGKVQAKGFNDFLLALTRLNNALDPRMTINGETNKDRVVILERIKSREKNRNPSADEAVAQAVDLLRVGQTDNALALLLPRTRSQPSYFLFLTLSHIYATRGEWMEAIQSYQNGRLDTEMPATLKGITAAQHDWWKNLDSTYLIYFYKIRQHETEIRKGLNQAELAKVNETEEVLPLFPLSDPKAPQTPVRYVNDAGVYQPGHLAAAERAKLPPDAIAIVQQFILWFPGETRLYWLLAELYAASNNLRAADTLFERCSWSRQFGNRKVMMEHRTAVRTVLPKDAPIEDAPLIQPQTESSSTPNPESPPTIGMQMIWYYFGAVGLVVVFAFVRAISRRNKIRSGADG